MIAKVNIKNKLALFNSHWDPKIVGELNNQLVKLVKFQGEFVWHDHKEEDELFLVVNGSFDMQLSDQTITINEGEFIIIPRGLEHKPVAKEEVHVLLFEPKTTVNTGEVKDMLTKTQLEKI